MGPYLLIDELDEDVQFQVAKNTNFVFSCTSSSNRRVKATNDSPGMRNHIMRFKVHFSHLILLFQ